MDLNKNHLYFCLIKFNTTKMKKIDVSIENLSHVSSMSSVVRQLLPILLAHNAGSSKPLETIITEECN